MLNIEVRGAIWAVHNFIDAACVHFLLTRPKHFCAPTKVRNILILQLFKN